MQYSQVHGPGCTRCTLNPPKVQARQSRCTRVRNSHYAIMGRHAGAMSCAGVVSMLKAFVQWGDGQTACMGSSTHVEWPVAGSANDLNVAAMHRQCCYSSCTYLTMCP